MFTKYLLALIVGVMLMVGAFLLPSTAHAAGLNSLTAESVNAWKASGHTEAEARRMQVGDCFVVTLQSGSYKDCLRHKGDTVWNRTRTNHGHEQRLAREQDLVLDRFAQVPLTRQETFKVAMRQTIGVETRAAAQLERPTADTPVAAVESDTTDEPVTREQADSKAPPLILLSLIGLILAGIMGSFIWGAYLSMRKSRPSSITPVDRTPYLDPRHPPPPL